MILYFSGTGNSEYAAKRIGKAVNDEIADLFEKIRSRDFSEMHSDKPWVITAPTYAWRMPRIVQEWLENTTLAGNRNVYFVLTCGADTGNAGRYLKKLCTSKNLNYSGCFEILMPDNYIVIFAPPSPEKVSEIMRKSESLIDTAAFLIRNGETVPEPAVTVKDKINSSIINRIFYPLFVHAKKFYAADTCTSCGKCLSVCPLNNIRLKNGKPAWGKSCTHCMACICRCPKAAIEYGNKSKGLARYVCPKTI